MKTFASYVVTHREIRAVLLVASLLLLWAVVAVPGAPLWAGLASASGLGLLLLTSATVASGRGLAALQALRPHRERPVVDPRK